MISRRLNKIKNNKAFAVKIITLIFLLSVIVLIYSCTNNAPASQTAFIPSVILNVTDSVANSETFPNNKPAENDNIPKNPDAPIIIDDKYLILNCPDVLQNNDYSCGVWAGLTVLGYYGITEYADSLAKQMNTNSETGTEMEDMVKVLRNYGLKTNMHQMSVEEIKDFVRQKIPVIVMLQAYNPTGIYQEGRSLESAQWGHYVTVIGYGDGNIVFKDPDTFGKMYLSEKEFKTRWKGTDEYNGHKEKILYNFGIVAYGKKPQFKKIAAKLEKMP